MVFILRNTVRSTALLRSLLREPYRPGIFAYLCIETSRRSGLAEQSLDLGCLLIQSKFLHSLERSFTYTIPAMRMRKTGTSSSKMFLGAAKTMTYQVKMTATTVVGTMRSIMKPRMTKSDSISTGSSSEDQFSLMLQSLRLATTVSSLASLYANVSRTSKSSSRWPRLN